MIVNVHERDKDQVLKSFESSLYFSGLETTRKASKGMYLLNTNKSLINKAQKEANNFIKILWTSKSTSTQELPKRKKNTYPQPSINLCSQIIPRHMPNSFSLDHIISYFLQTACIYFQHTLTKYGTSSISET